MLRAADVAGQVSGMGIEEFQLQGCPLFAGVADCAVDPLLRLQLEFLLPLGMIVSEEINDPQPEFFRILVQQLDHPVGHAHIIHGFADPFRGCAFRLDPQRVQAGVGGDDDHRVRSGFGLGAQERFQPVQDVLVRVCFDLFSAADDHVLKVDGEDSEVFRVRAGTAPPRPADEGRADFVRA